MQRIELPRGIQKFLAMSTILITLPKPWRYCYAYINTEAYFIQDLYIAIKKIKIMRIKLVAVMHLITCTTLYGKEGIHLSMLLYQGPVTIKILFS